MQLTLALAKKIAGKTVSNPVGTWRTLWSLWRGWRFKVTCRLWRRRVVVGKNLRIYGKLVVRGPGRVTLGDNIVIGMTVTPWTYAPEALIDIGSNTFLNGTRFGCKQTIRIGPYGILGDARIMDTDFHSMSLNRHDSEAPVRVASVELGENVWVAAQAGILPGTIIGDNSVVGFGAVCSGSYPANVLIVGNPAKVVRTLGGRATDQTPAPMNPGGKRTA
ncbi:MAG: acyltransferase [Pseudomonadota bacterium]